MPPRWGQVREFCRKYSYNDAMLAIARSALSEDAFAQAWAEGEAMTRDEAIVYALEEDGA